MSAILPPPPLHAGSCRLSDPSTPGEGSTAGHSRQEQLEGTLCIRQHGHPLCPLEWVALGRSVQWVCPALLPRIVKAPLLHASLQLKARILVEEISQGREPRRGHREKSEFEEKHGFEKRERGTILSFDAEENWYLPESSLCSQNGEQQSSNGWLGGKSAGTLSNFSV